MTRPDRTRQQRWHDQLLGALRRAGGDDLVHDALSEAKWYANLYTPWDGHGDEPTDRLTARLQILTQRLNRATTSSASTAPPSPEPAEQHRSR